MLLGTGYTYLADMWSAGVVAYTMLSGGVHPFHGKTPKQVVARILQCDYSFDEGGGTSGDGRSPWSGVSEDAKDFVRSLLRLRPEDRLTAQQAIRHDWIQRGRLRSQSSESALGAPAAPPVDLAGEAGPAAGQAGASDGACADPDLKHRVASGMVRYAEWASDFRKLALNAVAKRSTSEEIFEIRKVFDDFDTENTGTITLDEFRAALAQFGPSYPEDDLRELFRKIDIGGTSVINYTEFLAAALEAQGNIEEWRLAEAFALLDAEDSGYISRKNLRRIVGPDVDESYIDHLIEEAGGSPSEGHISYTDFLRAFGMQTQDLVYDMYEASETSGPGLLGATGKAPQPPSVTSASTDEILERNGIRAVRRSRSGGSLSAAGAAAAQTARFRSAVSASLRFLTPASSSDMHAYITTGQPGER
jgi:calcium-dependent protein kinase